MIKKEPAPMTAAVETAPRNDSMRRLQIGIAGVLAVMLLVGLAGVIGDRAREEVAEGNIAPTEVKMPGDEQKSGGEALVELGVQSPSKGEAKQETTVGDATPLTAKPTVPDLEPDPALERARKSTQ